jgi:F0F1-type ATP synthase assembly protein I
VTVPDDAGEPRGGQPAKQPGGGAGEAYRFLGIGLTWVLSTALGALLGVWLDRRLGTTPLLTLAGLVIGTVAGFGYLYHHAVVVPREQERARREQESK